MIITAVSRRKPTRLSQRREIRISVSPPVSPDSPAPLEAAAAVVADVAEAGLWLVERPRAALALGHDLHVHADVRRLVGVDGVRHGVDLQRVGAAAVAVLVLVEALVDAHHRDVDAQLPLEVLPVVKRTIIIYCYNY